VLLTLLLLDRRDRVGRALLLRLYLLVLQDVLHPVALDDLPQLAPESLGTAQRAVDRGLVEFRLEFTQALGEFVTHPGADPRRLAGELVVVRIRPEHLLHRREHALGVLLAQPTAGLGEQRVRLLAVSGELEY